MPYLLLIPLVYLAAVVDTAAAEVLRVGNVTPDLVALAAMVWVLLVRSRWAFLTAGAVALLGDLIAPGRVGVGAAWMLLVGFGLGWFVEQARRRRLADGLPARLLFTAAALTAWCLGVGLTSVLLGAAAQPLPAPLLQAFGAAAYTTAAALPVLMVAGWVRPTVREEV